MRIEKVIAINAADGVGPTRLVLLTAGSSKLPVVVMAQADGPPAYYVFDVAGLQAALTNQLSATLVREALQLSARHNRDRRWRRPRWRRRLPATRWRRTAG